MSPLDPRRLLAVFIDGLRPDAIEHMPFVRDIAEARPLTTELGYSVTCHASMYTGVRPDRHGLWFVWMRAPERSPFRGMSWLKPLGTIDTLPVRLGVQRFLRHRGRLASGGFFGVPRIVNLSMRWWRELAVAEDRLWWERGYIPDVPTLFEIIELNGGRWQFVKPPFARISDTPFAYPDPSKPDMAYLFVGDVDAVSHAAGQHSEAAVQVLRAVDDGVARAYAGLTARDGCEPALLLWSDHGHVVTRRTDAYQLARSVGVNLARWLHVIDANYIRIWGDDPRILDDIRKRLATIPIGFLLNDELLRRFRLPVGDRRWGDVIFYLDQPYVFSRTIWGFSRHMRSAHGYLPSHPDSDGVVVSSIPLLQNYQPHVVDIAPTILALTGMPIPSGLDGVSLIGPSAAAT